MAEQVMIMTCFPTVEVQRQNSPAGPANQTQRATGFCIMVLVPAAAGSDRVLTACSATQHASREGSLMAMAMQRAEANAVHE